jgi:phosphate starvation-inducible PhoH-like protein
MALEYLLEEKVKKIIITRPVLEAGEKIGYLPGTAEEKLHPYLLPILDEINHFISPALYASLKLNNRIEVVPLGLMRGRNFHDSFIVADECQNASYDQLKMLLTRLGRESKMVLTGDIGQSDLSRHLRGGFLSMIQYLDGIDNIGFSVLESVDIVRNPIIAAIISRLESYERQNESS